MGLNILALPAEIRIRIWRYALCIRVEVCSRSKPYDLPLAKIGEVLVWKLAKEKQRLPNPHLGLFLTCRTVYQEACWLPHYTSITYCSLNCVKDALDLFPSNSGLSSRAIFARRVDDVFFTVQRHRTPCLYDSDEDADAEQATSVNAERLLAAAGPTRFSEALQISLGIDGSEGSKAFGSSPVVSYQWHHLDCRRRMNVRLDLKGDLG